MTDWSYEVIDGRSASIKVIAQTANHKKEVFYFEYWNPALRWYKDHSNYYKEQGIKYQYKFYVKSKNEWLPGEYKCNI